MMQTDLHRKDLKLGSYRSLHWGAGLLAFCLTVAIGGAGALWSLQQLRAGSEREARQDARSMAQSVAQTLAQQMGRAVRLGIPLADIPGVPAYLQRALEQAPGLAYIALQQPDGATLHSTAQRKSSDQVSAPIEVQGKAAGNVLVGTAPSALAQGFAQAQALCALAVLGMGLLSGWLAARGPGARLQNQRALLEAGLRNGHHTHDTNAPAAEGTASDGLQQALQALAQGQQQLQEQQEAVAAYAQELLAVDFDQRMQAPIARILQDTAGAAGAADAVTAPKDGGA